VTTELKRLYTSVRTTPSQVHTGFCWTWPFTTASDLVFTWPSQGSTGVGADTRLLNHTQLVPLLRTQSAHNLPLKLPHVPQVFLQQQLANPHVIQAGWVWDEGETADVCIHGQSFKGVQVKGESSWGGSWGSRNLHAPLHNLQCGRRRMTFMQGSGRSRNYRLCRGKKKNPTGLLFLVWSWRKSWNTSM